MAKIEIIHEANKDRPRSVECFEVLFWGKGGQEGQEFFIGSGLNFNAAGNFWIEIRYSLQDIALFYTRNILQYLGTYDLAELQANLDKFLGGEGDQFGFGDLLPETSIRLKREKSNISAPDEDPHEYIRYSLVISADMGVVFGNSSPGERTLDFRFDYISLDEVLPFMRELIRDISQAALGHHPDPGSLPVGHSDWPFARQLNRQAYDQIAGGFQVDYFKNPRLRKAFNDWLSGLPAASHILDAGCGHGEPVLARLLERGFQVTGSDLSPIMLALARERFPGMLLWERAITEIEAESVFEGACSFSSMLYLDPIDLFQSIYRLYRALKPGGQLFLYGYELSPESRGEPYHVDLKHWMWGGTYSMTETAQALEEHGYFKVLRTLETGTKAERTKLLMREKLQIKDNLGELIKDSPGGLRLPVFDAVKKPTRVSYPYVVIAQKQER